MTRYCCVMGEFPHAAMLSDHLICAELYGKAEHVVPWGHVVAETPNGARVLVTGGAGFIGSELCRQLVALGASVTAVDNLVNGRRENLDCLPGEGCEL